MSRQQGLNESKRVDSYEERTVIDRIRNLEERAARLETNTSQLFDQISRLEAWLGVTYKEDGRLTDEPRRL